MFSSPLEILVTSSQIRENALPKIPALSKAETATHVCFFFEETIFGKNKCPAAAVLAKPKPTDFINFLFFIFQKLVGGTGIEPATYCVSSNCSPS